MKINTLSMCFHVEAIISWFEHKSSNALNYLTNSKSALDDEQILELSDTKWNYPSNILEIHLKLTYVSISLTILPIGGYIYVRQHIRRFGLA